MKRIGTIIISIILLSTVSYAGTPEEISKSYFEMLKQKKWTEVAKLYDTTALRDFKEMMSFMLEIPDEAATQVLGTFFGPGTTKKSVKAMSDLDFFSFFLRGVMAQAVKHGQLDFKKVEIIGAVPEGVSLRHVVTRTHIGMAEITVEALEVISFRKKGGKWGILLQGKIKGIAHRLRKAFERNKQ